MSQCAFKYHIKNQCGVVSDSSFRGDSLRWTLNSKIIIRKIHTTKSTWSALYMHCENLWYDTYRIHIFIFVTFTPFIEFSILFSFIFFKSLFLSVCIEQSESIYHKCTQESFHFFFRLKIYCAQIIDGFDGGDWSHLICLKNFSFKMSET